MHDDDLLEQVRGGDTEVYGLLFARHRPVAARVAWRVAGPGEADDVVAEAFVRVLAQVVEGGGPVRSFRAYLLATVRHEAMRRARMARRCEPRDDLEPAAQEDTLALDHDLQAAYRSLPPRWRQVLWDVEVEGARPRELADELGLTPNAVAALACRARAGLRAAYRESRAA